MIEKPNFLNNKQRTIAELPADNIVTIMPMPENISNIYVQKAPESISFLLNSEYTKKYSIRAEMVNPFGESSFISSQDACIDEKITVDLPDISQVYGVFKLNITVFDGEREVGCQGIPFSHVRKGDSPFKKCGSCIHQFFHDIPNTYDLAELMKIAGINKIRDDFQWDCFEKEKGKIAVPENYKNTVKYFLDNGFELHPILAHGHKFYGNNTREVFSTNEGLKAYHDFCKETAKSYKGKIFNYEVWNEYNLSNNSGDPKSYVKILKTAYDAIKSVDEKIKVTAGVTCGTHTAWVRAVMEAGAYDYFDEFSIHPYTMLPDWAYPDDTQGDMEENVKLYSSVISEYGKPKPVWISEIGWTTNAGESSLDRVEQAACYTRLFAITESSSVIERTIMYDLCDDGKDPFEVEFHWGLLETMRAVVPNAAKESYVAICCLNYMIGNAVYEKTTVKDSIKVITFKKDGKFINIVWSLDGKKLVTFDVDGSPVIYDMYGNENTSYQDMIKLSLTVNDIPVYICDASFEISNVSLSDIEYAEDYELSAVPELKDDGWYLKAVIFNHAKPLDCKLRLELPEKNIFGKYSRFVVKSGEKSEVEIKVGDIDFSKLYRAIIDLNLSDGKRDVRQELVSFLSVPYGIPESMPYSLTAENDYVGTIEDKTPELNADFGLGYDENNLYLKAQVFEKNHIQYGTVRLDSWMDIWDGDGIEMIVQPLYNGNRKDTRYNDLGFALTSETNETIAWRWKSVESRGYGRFRKCKLNVSRENGITSYFAEIPWKELLPPNVLLEDCDSFGFALRINYAESTKNSIDGYMQLYGGIGSWRTPYSYQPLEFGRFVLKK